MRKTWRVAIACILVSASIGCGGGNTSSPAVPAANVAGKWEFANGINVNLTQNGSSIGGTGVHQTLSSSPPNTPNTLLVNPCHPDTVTGQATGAAISIQSGDCGFMAATASGSVLSGGEWGDGFQVPSISGQYSGTLTLYDSSGNSMGTTNLTLSATEDASHNISAVLTFAGSSPTEVTGRTVGGILDLDSEQLVGRVGKDGSLDLTVLPGVFAYCTYFGCSSVGNGTVK